MDLTSFLIRNLTYPLWMIKDGDRPLLKYLRYFNFIDNLSSAELEERQIEALKAHLVYAYENAPYYRRVFDASGFSPHTIKDKGDIRKVPLLTKDIIKKNFDDLKAAGLKPEFVHHATTGGSTGVPMSFLRNKESIYLRKGQELFFDRWMGYELGNKVALFVAVSHYEGPIEHLKARIRNVTCERMLNFNPHHITDGYMEEFYGEYKKFRPSMIKCFPNSLAIFADFINRKGLKAPTVRAISCTGETLYSKQRKAFENTFSGEVFEKYGTRESGVIACECRLHKGLHVFTEGAYMELLKDDGSHAGPGEMGAIVITDFFNKAMPLIRYVIGDMAVASDGRVCGCGSQLPLIEKLLGRDRDIIIDSDGNPKPGYLFVEIINKLNLSAQFQVIQTESHTILVKIAQGDPGPVDTEGLKAKFKEIVGPLFRIDFEFVPGIPRDPSGKYRYVVSMIKSNLL